MVFRYLPDIYREYKYVNLCLLILVIVFIIYPIGVSIPGGVESYLPFSLPTVPSLVHVNYPDLPCSSCGLTRSVVSLYHFDLDSALAYNRAGVLIVVLSVLQFLLRFPLFFWKSSALCWVDLFQLTACGLAVRLVLDVSVILDL
jgi:Protein of unknown function (DUF2752)